MKTIEVLKHTPDLLATWLWMFTKYRLNPMSTENAVDLLLSVIVQLCQANRVSPQCLSDDWTNGWEYGSLYGNPRLPKQCEYTWQKQGANRAAFFYWISFNYISDVIPFPCFLSINPHPIPHPHSRAIFLSIIQTFPGTQKAPVRDVNYFFLSQFAFEFFSLAPLSIPHSLISIHFILLFACYSFHFQIMDLNLY